MPSLQLSPHQEPNEGTRKSSKRSSQKCAGINLTEINIFVKSAVQAKQLLHHSRMKIHFSKLQVIAVDFFLTMTLHLHHTFFLKAKCDIKNSFYSLGQI